MPQVDARKKEVARRCGRSRLKAVTKRFEAARHLHAGQRSRTRLRPSPRPADRRTRCCTCSRWRARPVSSCEIDDFQTISERTPLMVDLKPAGKFVAVDVDKAGGWPVVAKRLVDGGYVDGSCNDRHRHERSRKKRRKRRKRRGRR